MEEKAYLQGFVPYALGALLVGIVGGFGAVLGPAFVQDLNLPYQNTTWTALATAVSGAACAPILGKLGDAVGRRKTLLLGIWIFALGNGLTAAAPGLFFMLLARFVSGIGMAAIAPVVLSYILTEFPREKTAQGFSLYMLISSGAVILGPTLGSLIIGFWGWRVMMWLCTALSVAIGLYCTVLKGERDRRRSLRGFDFPGAVLVLVFFSLVLCVPSFGQNMGWDSPAFFGVLLGAVLSGAGLVLAERRADHPILPGSLLLRRPFVLTVAALFLTQGLLQANMTNTIVFVNYTRPEQSQIAGYAISVMYLGMALGAVLLGPLADRREPKWVLTGAFGITAAGCALTLLYSHWTPVWLLMGSLGILGFGLGANGTVFLKVALSGLSPETAGAGTGAYGLFRDLAAPFGVAVLVPLFTNRVSQDIAAGMARQQAAVESIRFLALTELACIGAGLGAVLLLPRVREK